MEIWRPDEELSNVESAGADEDEDGSWLLLL